MSKVIRLSRAQFLPVIISPIILGTATAWYTTHALNPLFFGLALLGGALLHLASNIINDVYDYASGVDAISERSFPPDFPGWKVLPRRTMTPSLAKTYGYLFYLSGILIGLYFAVVTGWPILILGIMGFIFSYAYTAPPLQLDYRGFGLGELSIFFSFGPIPVLGAYFVQARSFALPAVLASIPVGLLTTSLLMNHDLIFHDIYKEGGKRSLAVVLGRRATMKLTLGLSVFCYIFVATLALLGIFPATALIVLPAFVVLAVLARIFMRRELQVPDYAKATEVTLIHSLLFGILLAIGFVLA